LRRSVVTSGNQPQPGSWFANHPRVALPVALLPFLLLGLLERTPGTVVPALLYFVAAGVWALYVTPRLLGLPYGRKSLREYCTDIRLLPVAPVGRNMLLGVALAVLTLSGILLAALLTNHFVLDWSTVPGLRWVKGLTRGVWEEVFFRGILLVILMRLYSRRNAVLWATFIFAAAHLNVTDISLAAVVDVVSIFLMGLLFAYVVLKTGSLLPAIVFHYMHDVFVNLVQNTPGANETTALVLLYAFLWIALAVGAGLTKFTVEHWPARGLACSETQEK
jgi:membrane protease YdiL (CAAX protease family)